MKTWRMGNDYTGNAYHGGYVANGAFYIRKLKEGLMIMQGDTLALVPDGERFADERIYVMLPYDDEGRILVGSRTQGLFIYNGVTFQHFTTEADQYLRNHPLYMPGAALGNGWLLNTLGGGAIVLDRNGKLLHILDRNNGLADDVVISVYANPARPEEQWLALNNGIARVEATGPFTTFGAERALTSMVNKIQRHNGLLHVATSTGVFYLDPISGMFKPITMPVSESWDLLSIGDHLLAASDKGVYSIRDGKAGFIRQSRSKDFEAHTLYRSQADSHRVFVGTKYGVSILELKNGAWHDAGHVPGFEDEVSSLAEMKDGRLWAGTSTKGVLLLTFSRPGEKSLKNVQVERFGRQHGLPEGSVSVYEFNNRFYFAISADIYRFDAGIDRFVADSTFMGVKPSGKWKLNAGETGQLWSVGKGMALGTLERDRQYEWLKAPFGRFSDEVINTSYSEKNGVVWFGGPDGLIRYDSNVGTDYALDYPALVRRVIAGEDSVIFDGAWQRSVPHVARLSLPYTHNNLRFQYAASSYEDAGRLQFQTRLEGFDDYWSSWSNKTEKSYTNLPEGHYRLRVRAKNIYDHMSQEGVYAFAISPPWYRAWWAYGGYAVLFGLLVFAADRVQRRRLLKKERESATQGSGNSFEKSTEDQKTGSGSVKRAGSDALPLFRQHLS